MSVFGFDFGNESSCVAVARKNGIDVLLNKESRRETPSVVSFGHKKRYIGTDGEAIMGTNRKNTVTNLKRLLGKKFFDQTIQEDLKKYSFECLASTNGGIQVRVDYLGAQYDIVPEQLVAIVLNELKCNAELETKSPVTDCAIGVPVYFTENERHAILSAAKLSKINCLRLLNDNTATALSYGIYKTDLSDGIPTNVVFIDIGHSSLQVSVVAFKKGQLRVISHAWDRNLGGRDFDVVLFEYFSAELERKHKININDNSKSAFRLWAAVEKVKKVLSANLSSPISVECIIDEIDLKSSITREKFEELAMSTLQKIKDPILKALKDSGIKSEQISAIEVVGGASRMPAFLCIIRDIFGRDPSRTMNSKECVAKGCALGCAMISPLFRVREFQIIEASAYGHSLKWQSENCDKTLILFKKNENHTACKHKTITLIGKSCAKICNLCIYDTHFKDNENQMLSSYEIGPYQTPTENKKIALKAKIGHDMNGILKVDAVYFDENISEPAQIKLAETKNFNGKSSLKLNHFARKHPVSFIARSSAILKDTMDKFFEEESRMDTNDKVQEKILQRRNALESYVYETRDKLSGDLAEFLGTDRSLILRVD
jgi:heat shock protein 4